MKMLKKISIGLIASVLIFTRVALAQNVEPTKEWLSFLENLKKEMLAKGISEKTIEKAYGRNTYFHPNPEVVAQDKKQAEFILTTREYLNRLVNEERVQKARRHYKNLKKKYAELENEYQVPINYLVAFWAVETNFGQNKGKYHLIDGLTNLSYRNRRSKFFKNELYHVLKIMDKFDLENEKMLGSWAGAMGHFQFMPSTYNAYAKDFDGDGIIDIWDSFDDAIGSAANYLHDLGWKKDEPWGLAVRLPWDFDYSLTGYHTRKTLREWSFLGLKDKSGKRIALNQDLKGSVIIPDGRKGQAYLVFQNFRRIMIWNRSENYALAIGLLADYIASNSAYRMLAYEHHYALTNEDILKVQKFANKVYRAGLKEDGKLGPKTKDAVRKIQQDSKMQVDGYPSYQLLKKLEKYDAKIGFHVPAPEKKKLKSVQK